MGKTLRTWPYFGGKAKFAKNVVSCIPDDYLSWYELFVGGGSITFNREKPDSCINEVINDYDKTITNFYRVLSGKDGERLINELKSRGISEEIFEEAHMYVECFGDGIEGEDFYVALDTYKEIAASFSAMRKNFARGRKESVYRNAIEYNLPLIRRRLQTGIEIRNENALDILDSIKEDKGAFVYLDPPYLMKLRNGKGYRIEMEEFEHEWLMEILQKCKCRVLLSGYRDEYGENLYDSYLIPYGYRVYQLCEVTKSCQSAEEKSKGIEYIWCNYDLPANALVDREIIVKDICA